MVASSSDAAASDGALCAIRAFVDAARTCFNPSDLAQLAARAVGQCTMAPLAVVIVRGEGGTLIAQGWSPTGSLDSADAIAWAHRLGLHEPARPEASPRSDERRSANGPAPPVALRSGWRCTPIPGIDDQHGWMAVARSSRPLVPADPTPNAAEEACVGLLATLLGSALDMAASRARLSCAERRCQALQALYETARDVASQLDLDAVLHAILVRARDLIGTALAYLNLRDPVTGDLHMRATLGIRSEAFRRLRVRSDEGFAGLALRTRSAVYVRDILTDPRRLPSQEASRIEEGLRSVLAAPMIVRDEPIGVLYVANRHVTEFRADDEALLCGLANIAAVAIKNAQLHEEQRRALRTLQELSALTTEQYTRLRRSMAIHDQLTQLVLKDRGVEAICAALAGLLGNPVVVENPWFAEIASSLGTDKRVQQCRPPGAYSTPLAAREDPEVGPYFQRLASERQPIQLPPLPHLGLDAPRVVAPILAGSELLGYLSVIEADRKLDELDFIAIEHAATILALELIKRRAATAAEERILGQFLDQLLRGDLADQEAVDLRARALGLDPARPHRVIVVSCRARQTVDVAGEAGRQRWLEIACGQLKERQLRGLVGWHEDACIVLVPADAPPNEARNLAAALVRQLVAVSATSAGGRAVVAGIGSPSASLAGVRRSYAEALRAIALAASLGLESDVVDFDDLGVYRLLHSSADPAELARFAERILGPLRVYDAEHKTEFVRTLDTYLWHACHLRRTARALFLHVHSLRYRLQRIERILGCRLDDPRWRLDAQVALAAARLAGRLKPDSQPPR